MHLPGDNLIVSKKLEKKVFILMDLSATSEHLQIETSALLLSKAMLLYPPLLSGTLWIRLIKHPSMVLANDKGNVQVYISSYCDIHK
jgi:hypothetical protein